MDIHFVLMIFIKRRVFDPITFNPYIDLIINDLTVLALLKGLNKLLFTPHAYRLEK